MRSIKGQELSSKRLQVWNHEAERFPSACVHACVWVFSRVCFLAITDHHRGLLRRKRSRRRRGELLEPRFHFARVQILLQKGCMSRARAQDRMTTDMTKWNDRWKQTLRNGMRSTYSHPHHDDDQHPLQARYPCPRLHSYLFPGRHVIWRLQVYHIALDIAELCTGCTHCQKIIILYTSQSLGYERRVGHSVHDQVPSAREWNFRLECYSLQSCRKLMVKGTEVEV